GGYPELHLDSLADNGTLLAAIRRHHRAGKPIVAECGGMLYLLESLARADGHRRALAGLIPADAAMGERLGGLGLQAARFAAGRLRGHAFHDSPCVAPPPSEWMATRYPGGGEGEGLF